MTTSLNREGREPRASATVQSAVSAVILLALALLLGALTPEVKAAAEVLVGPGSTLTYVANATAPGLGFDWVLADYDDSAWQSGQFGIGYETFAVGATDLISTAVPPATVSIFARARFELPAVPVEAVHLGLDFDDGVVAWINGIEVYRSPQMPAGALSWDTSPMDHESSNDSMPQLFPLLDISEAGMSALHAGENVLAIGAWNTTTTSTDLVLVPRLSINDSLELVRGPYLQNASETTVKLRWRTNLPSTSLATYGSTPDELNRSRVAYSHTSEHSIELTHLLPDTRYYYALGDESATLAGGDESYSFVTPPVRGTPKPTRVWVLGDSGTGTDQARAVRDAYYAHSQDRATDLWLMLGDNAYPDGTDGNYQSALFDVFGQMLRESVLWPTLGNHELIRANNETQTGAYFDIFELPTGAHAGGAASGTESYYSFDYANVHFVVLDSNDSDRSTEGAMLTWLAEDLAASTQDWLIAYWHHSPYSHGSHDSDTEIELIEMRENAVPLLEDHGVDLILTAHSHSYERSYLIDGHHDTSDTLDDTMKLDAGDGGVYSGGAYAKAQRGPDPHSGAVYTVAGSSGHLTEGALDHPAMVRSLPVLGSVILDIDGDRLDASFLDDRGEIRDAYTLIKGCADPNQHFASHATDPAPSSDIYTPGLCDGGPPCASDTQSSVSSDLRGAFWRLGAGDPELGPGVDSGDYPAWEPSGPGWVRVDAGAPAYIASSWAADARIDGCLVDAPGPRCMATMLGDQDQGVGYFTLLTALQDAEGGFSFAQDGGVPIELARLPRPLILGSVIEDSITVAVEVGLQQLVGGLYLDDACASDPIVGYKLYELHTDREAPFPGDRTRDNGDPATGWIPAAGGAGAAGEPLPLGTPASVTLTCYTATDITLGASLVLDSGYETPFVSIGSSRLVCSHCEFDNDLDASCGQFLNQAAGPDCDDGNADVYPGAAQICGDRINNDCSHPNWPALGATNETDDDDDGFTECDGDCADDNVEVWGFPTETGTLQFTQDKQSFVWNTPSDFGGLQVGYDVLRTPDPADFVTQAICLGTDQGVPFANDSQTPAVGETFYYLVRPKNACGGVLGGDSTGAERIGRSCP